VKLRRTKQWCHFGPPCKIIENDSVYHDATMAEPLRGVAGRSPLTC